MAATGVGAILGYSSPVTAQLLTEGYDEDATSWIASLLMLGAFGGGIIGGPMNVRFGKRWTLIIISVPFLVGCLLLTVYVIVYVNRPYNF